MKICNFQEVIKKNLKRTTGVVVATMRSILNFNELIFKRTFCNINEFLEVS